MTDTTQNTTSRENAIMAAAVLPILGSDVGVLTEVAQVEACVVKNQGIILGCLTSLPSPVLAILKSLAHIMLIPLHVIARLPLNSIYNGLNDFANGKNNQALAPILSSDCAPAQTV